MLAIVLVHPSGEFPINDDWSYAETVQRLVEHGEWRLNPWTSMPLATQVLWGWLFSQPMGFSFTTLRVSTLVLAWAATLGSYSLLRLSGAVPTMACAGAAIVALCPVVFPLAFTFMTDVPALAFGVWALVCVLHYANTGRPAYLVGAMLLLVATTLIRQTGVAFAIGAMAALLTVPAPERRPVAAVACLVVPAAALFAYGQFLRFTGTPSVYSLREGQLLHVLSNPRLLASLAFHSAAGSYFYAGLFVLPAVPLFARVALDRRAAIAAGAALAASATYVVKYGVQMPFFGNVLHDVGLSPILVARADLWPRAPAPAWVAVTIAAGLAAAVVVYHVVSRGPGLWAGPGRVPAVLAFVSCAAYLAPLFAAGFMFDRYLGPVVILVLAFLTSLGSFRSMSRASASVTLALVGVLAAFDIAATRDLFSFNRARWQATDAVLRTGVPIENFQGGFEVTGALLNRVTGAENPPLLISLGDEPGYARVSSHEFPRLIGSNPGVLYVLQRKAEPR